MKRISFVLMAVMAFVAMSCGNGRMTDEKISQLEKNMFNADWSLNVDKGRELVAAYCQYVDENPESEKSETYLFKAVDVSMNLPDVDKTFEIIDKFLAKYPNNSRAPQVMFTKALIYDDNLRDYDKARKCYEMFIEKYPDHELVRDAEASLRNLGKTPEELIKEFESRMQNAE